MAAQNRIHTIKMDLHLESVDDSFDTANEMVDSYKNVVLKLVEDFFSHIEIKEPILIENLSFDVSGVTNEDELKSMLLKQLQAFFSKYHNTNISIHKGNDEVHEETIEPSKSLGIDELMLFLGEGFFKWEYHSDFFYAKGNKESIQKLLIKHFEEHNPQLYIQYFIKYPYAIFRLFYYFPKLKSRIISILIPHSYKTKKSSFNYLEKQFINQINELESRSIRQEIIVFFEVINYFHQINKPSALLIACIFIEYSTGFDTLASLILAHKLGAETSVFSKNILKKIINQLYKSHQIEISESGITAVFDRLIAHSFESEIKSLKDRKSFNEENSFKTIGLEINYKHCGVLFLHPYFNELFTKSGLLDNTLFINLEAKIKAAQMLFYMATSKNLATEEDYRFFKTLLEIEEDVFIPCLIALSNEEKSDCIFFIKKLILDWSVLKSTAIETLQKQFFQRNGVVMLEKQSINVHLEKSAFDVLLEHYPYNYSLIKLSWLDKLLCVIV